MSEVLVTGAVTATISRMHACSGTTADYTVTLPPAAGNDGKSIGFRMVPGLTKLVTIDGNASETIDGATTRVMWEGETAILYCDNSNWFKIVGKSIPMMCRIHRAADQGSVANNTVTAVQFDTTALDNTVMMADLANDRIVLKRPGAYAIAAAIIYKAISANSVRCLTQVGGGTVSGNAECPGTATGYPTPFFSNTFSGLAAGNVVTLSGLHVSGVNESYLGNVGTFLSLTEVPLW